MFYWIVIIVIIGLILSFFLCDVCKDVVVEVEEIEKEIIDDICMLLVLKDMNL